MTFRSFIRNREGRQLNIIFMSAFVISTLIHPFIPSCPHLLLPVSLIPDFWLHTTVEPHNKMSTKDNWVCVELAITAPDAKH